MSSQTLWLIGIAAYLVIGHATWIYIREQAVRDYNPAQIILMYFLTLIFWAPILIGSILKGRKV